jgi:murein DD-endopeptidase MepM/ murein hydrolase activator NlpD
MLLFLPVLYQRETARWSVREPYYASPVAASGPALPLRSDAYGKGYFGARRNNGRTHKGIDIRAPLGSPILASKSGRVSVAAIDKGYGIWVEINHPDGLRSRYAHLSEAHVRNGQWVRAGQNVGLCGKTGNADAQRIVPHLHFEIRYKTHALNPSEKLLDPSIALVR